MTINKIIMLWYYILILKVFYISYYIIILLLKACLSSSNAIKITELSAEFALQKTLDHWINRSLSSNNN